MPAIIDSLFSIMTTVRRLLLLPFLSTVSYKTKRKAAKREREREREREKREETEENGVKRDCV